jgi:bacterial/archaeal transporter family-2 protein
MSDVIWIGIVVLLGCTQALQVALLGAMNRARGPLEAAYVSILGTLVGMSIILTIRGVVGARPALPAPFDQPVATGVVALVTGSVLTVAMRGLPAGFVLTGLLAAPYLLAASYLAPKIGIALFVAALIAGQLAGGLILDQLGAFGGATRPVDAVRLLGVAALLAGVALVRGVR